MIKSTINYLIHQQGVHQRARLPCPSQEMLCTDHVGPKRPFSSLEAEAPGRGGVGGRGLPTPGFPGSPWRTPRAPRIPARREAVSGHRLAAAASPGQRRHRTATLGLGLGHVPPRSRGQSAGGRRSGLEPAFSSPRPSPTLLCSRSHTVPLRRHFLYFICLLLHALFIFLQNVSQYPSAIVSPRF